MDKRKCILCGDEFKPQSFNQTICTKEHKSICPNCGKEFIMSYYQKKNFIKTGIVGCCSSHCRLITSQKTRLERYGYKQNVKKCKQTKLERYGDENYNNMTKNKQTKLKKYGNENYNNVEKNKQTKLERYGDENYNNRDKYKNTVLKNNGGVFRTPEQTQSMLETKYKKYGKGNNGEKIKQTFKKKSIVEKRKICDKVQTTLMKKYGVKFASHKHISKETLSILEDKDNFYNFCNQHRNELSLVNCAKILGISDTCFARYYFKYNMKDYFTLIQTSYIEKDIQKFLNDLNIKYISNTRSIITPKELDIFVPDKNVAIECNGLYWHSNQHINNPKYHYNKSVMCEDKGIRLIHIYEYEWNNDRQRPILENIIKNALGINTNKIYARNCKIIVMPSKDMRDFFNENNIQGFRGGKFAICLADKNTNEIYMSYMMGKAYFGKGKYEWEVIRGATKLGYTVIGGASKIFKYFIDIYKPKNCVYYIDYNYFNGNSLKNLPDMKYIKTQPSFKNYFRLTNEVRNRDPMHHKEITEGYKNGSILQIWNAGTKVYLWERT